MTSITLYINILWINFPMAYLKKFDFVALTHEWQLQMCWCCLQCWKLNIGTSLDSPPLDSGWERLLPPRVWSSHLTGPSTELLEEDCRRPSKSTDFQLRTALCFEKSLCFVGSLFRNNQIVLNDLLDYVLEPVHNHYPVRNSKHILSNIPF